MISNLSGFIVSNSLVVLLAATILLVSRRWFYHAAMAHLIWLALLVKLATPPLVNLPVPVDPFIATPLVAESSTSETPRFESTLLDRESTVSTASTSADSIPAESPKLPLVPEESSIEHVQATNVGASLPFASWTMVAMAVWFTGALTVLIATILKQRDLYRLLRHTREAERELQTQVERLAKQVGITTPVVRVTTARIVPCVYGSGRRAILLMPLALVKRFNADELYTVIAHELAHLHRRDHSRGWLEVFLVSLLWWNPLAWLCKRQLRLTADECCDGWVLRWFPESAIAYASGMLKTVDYLADGGRTAPGTAYGFGESQSLKRRFQAVLKNKTQCGLHLWSYLLLIGMTATVVLLGPVVAQRPLPELQTGTEPAAGVVASKTLEQRYDERTIASWISNVPDLPRDVRDAILDWVDEDNDARAFGAEAEFYQNLTPPYAPRNGAINELEELLLVRGMNWKVFRSLAEQAGKDRRADLKAVEKIDEELASRGVVNIGRHILGRIPGMTEEAADAILDWIDDDNEVREFGAEREFYESRSPDEQGHAWRWNARELQRIRGITPALADRVLEFFVAEVETSESKLPKPLGQIRINLGQLSKHFNVVESRFYESGQFRTPDPRPRVVKEDTVVLQLQARHDLPVEKLRSWLQPFPTIHFQKKDREGHWVDTELRKSGYFLYPFWNRRPLKKGTVLKAWIHLGSAGAAGLAKSGATHMRVETPDGDNAKEATGSWGHIKGRFVLHGEIPTPRRLRVLRDARELGDFVIDQSLVVDSKTRGISNILIVVTSKPGKIHPSYQGQTKTPHELTYSGGHIQPRINLVRVGQQVKIVNRDPIPNHAAIHTMTNPPVSVLLPARAHNQLVYKKPEKIPARVADNIHVFHQAYLLVKDHPYMTVTDKQGRFEMKNLPAGELEIRCWHERTGWIQAKPDWKNRRLSLKVKDQVTTDLGELQLHSNLFKN